MKLNFKFKISISKIRCRFPKLCIPYSKFQKVNPSSDLLIDGECIDGCYDTDVLEYEFSIFYTFDKNLTSYSVWNSLPYTDGYATGIYSSGLTLLPELFQNFSDILYWKLNLKIVLNGVSTGQSSIILKINQLPRLGTCSVDKTNGTSLLTVFTITCINWKDIDGTIEKYEYFGKI